MQQSTMIKLLIVGDSGVGKSSILQRFSRGEFDANQLTTIGVDFKEKVIQKDQVNVKLFIWDTAGQERFRTLTQSYYRGTHGVILVYDCSDESSFNNLSYWVNEVHQHCGKEVKMLLVGNKIDKIPRVISTEKGMAFAHNNSMTFIETSALQDTGIELCFDQLVSEVLSSPEFANLPQNQGSTLEESHESFLAPYCPC